MSRLGSHVGRLLAVAFFASSAAGCGTVTRGSVPAFDEPLTSTESRTQAKPAKSFVYVADYIGTGGINVYPADISGPRVLRTIHVGVSRPTAIWVDAAGRLYVANAGTNDVTVYAPQGSKPELVVRDGLHLPDAVTTDAQGNLWVANANRASVVEYAPGGLHPIATLTSGIVLPDGLAFDASGNLYVANSTSDRNTLAPGNVAIYASGTTSPTRTITAGIFAPAAIAIDAAQTLYVADNFSSSGIVEYAEGASSPALTVTSGTKFPTSVTVDRAGTMYAGSGYLNLVSEYALGGTYAIGSIQGHHFSPAALAIYPAPNP